jgi:amino acid adenylation domain-containing protein
MTADRNNLNFPEHDSLGEVLIKPEWCISVSEYPRMSSLHELFEEQVAQHPSAWAVSEGQQKLTYTELNRQVNDLAWFLIRSGLEPESTVAILMDRSIAMIVGMLAVVKAGGTYVPLDEHCPLSRLRLIFEDAGIQIALADEANAGRLEGIPATVLICGGTDESAGGAIIEDPPIVSGPLSRAYVMYTSGSTGTPKGVQVINRGIIRLVRNTNYVDFRPSDVVAQIANPSFDAITFEVWGALLNGGRIAILKSSIILSPDKFAAAIATGGITVMFLTASLFSVLADTVPAAFGTLRTLVVGGDAVNPQAARTILNAAPPERLVNGYGPTECTTFSICHRIRYVPQDAVSIPIGRPISNSEAYILNGALRMAPPGEEGDLYLGGDGLARGYLNRPELDAERFIPHPFNLNPGAKLYKTGDRARFLETGIIEFLGRQDHQVKFHGYRIELGEIENALRKHPGVVDAVVKIWQGSRHDGRLVAYASLRAASACSEADLRDFLAKVLPEYMVPSHVVVLASLPLTSVGKVDRASLPDPTRRAPPAPTSSVNTELETNIKAIWKRVLSLNAVGVHDKFFDLGGTSLTLALVEHQLRRLVAAPFEITDLFRFPTIATLAAFLSGGSAESSQISEAQQRARRQKAAFRAQAPDRIF